MLCSENIFSRLSRALVTMFHSRVASYLMLHGTTFLAKVFRFNHLIVLALTAHIISCLFSHLMGAFVVLLMLATPRVQGRQHWYHSAHYWVSSAPDTKKCFLTSCWFRYICLQTYNGEHMNLFSTREASYNGGGNIVFKGRLEGDVYFTARLFKPLLHLSSSPITVSYSVSPSVFRYTSHYEILLFLY